MAVSVACGAAGLARAADPACQVTGLRGTAALDHDGVRSALAAGMALVAGDTITTAAGTRVKLHFADGSEVRLGENAILRINVVEIDAEEGIRNILLSLPMGLLRAAAAKLAKSAGSSFEVHTGIGYSAVRGTHWIVDAQAAETKVYVQEGRVAVGADFKTNQFPKLVEGGHWISVTRQVGIGALQDTPPDALEGLIDQTEASLAPGLPDENPETVTETATAVLGGTTETVSDVAGAVFGTASAVVGQATTAVSNVTGAVTSAAGAAVGQTTSAVSNTVGAVSSTAGAAVGQTTSAVSNTVGAVSSTVGAAVGQTTSTVSATTGAVASAANSAVSAVGKAVSSATGSGSSGSGSGGSSGGGSSAGGSGGGSSSGGSSSGAGSSSGGASSSGGSSSGGSSSGGGSGSSNSGGKSLGGSVRDALGKIGGLL